MPQGGETIQFPIGETRRQSRKHNEVEQIRKSKEQAERLPEFDRIALNAAIRHARNLLSESSKQQEVATRNDEEALEIYTKSISRLLQATPILLPRSVNTLKNVRILADKLGRSQVDQPILQDMLFDLAPEEFTKLVPASQRRSLLVEPRVLKLVSVDPIKVTSERIADVVIRQLQQGDLRVNDLDAAVFELVNRQEADQIKGFVQGSRPGKPA